MDDAQIVQLYWDRNEQAIRATSDKYGNYCTSIAKNILGDQEDAEECVNDTYLNAWNAMPPHRPSILSTFLGKITRNLSFNRYKLILSILVDTFFSRISLSMPSIPKSHNTAYVLS